MNKQIPLTILSLLVLGLVINNFYNSNYKVQVNDDQCPESLAVQCAVDIQQTVKTCSKAFETQGTDIIADIKCAKYMLADKSHCWPCICDQAKKRGWKIIGC